MEEILIYKRLAEINKEVKSIGKNQRNQQQGFMFRGIDDVMNDLHELFAKHEVIVLPEVMDFTIENRTTKTGSLNAFTRLKVKFSYVTTDGSSVNTINIGESQDTADKGMNKAMSVALKYSLTQMFLIPTSDMKDPDATTPEETVAPNHIPAQPANPAPTQQPSDYAAALQEVRNAKSRAEAKLLWNKYKDFQHYAEFSEEIKIACQKFPKQATA